jgi:hypothetical protein
MKSIPNRVGHKRIKKYDILSVEVSKILIFKQADGEALHACHKVVKYSNIFDAVWENT